MTESWCDDRITNSYLNIDGYELIVRQDRKDKAGGGILFYSLKNINVVPGSSKNNFNQFVSCEIPTVTGPNLTVYIVYRPPDSCDVNYVENVKLLCDLVEKSSENSLFVGDFNFPSIDWQTLSCPDTSSKLFLDSCNNKFMTQHVD